MWSQKGVDNNAYLPLHPKTVKQKQKVSTSTASLRMIRTKDFINRAFKTRPATDGVTVFITKALHGRDIKTAKKKETRKKLVTAKYSTGRAKAISMSKIAQYQLQKGHSKFFPTDATEAQMMDSYYATMEYMLKDAEAQIKKGMAKSLNLDLRVM